MFYKHVISMNEEEKHLFSKTIGNTLLWIEEGGSIAYMSDKLHLSPMEVEHNIDEMLYALRRQVGIKRFIKTLFRR